MAWGRGWNPLGSQVATQNSVACLAVAGLVAVTTRVSLEASWLPALGWANLALACHASAGNLSHSRPVGPQERT